MNAGHILIYIISYFGLFTAIFFLLTLFENLHRLKNPKPKKIPSVTLIVPAYNEEKTIEKTIKSLLALNYPKDKLKIVIVDDGSKDNTYKISKKYEGKNLKVCTKENGGKGSALNYAIKRSRTEFIGGLDADSFVTRNALKKIVGYFDNPKVMAVTPSLKVYKPKNFLQKIQMMEYLAGVFLRKIFAFLDSIHVTPGPFTIYRRSFFEKYGYFDEDNITEDIEIALRIQKHNFLIENSADAEVFTVAPAKFTELLKQRVRWYVGFIQNVKKYTSLFGRQHGHLGSFILPVAFISALLVIIVLFYAAFRFVSNAFQNIMNYYLVGFDFKTLMQFKIDLFFLNLNAMTVLAVFCLLFSISMIYFAKKISNEKSKIRYSYVMYLFFYWLLFGFWWVIACSYQIFGKKVTWGGKTA